MKISFQIKSKRIGRKIYSPRGYSDCTATFYMHTGRQIQTETHTVTDRHRQTDKGEREKLKGTTVRTVFREHYYP